MRTLIPGFRLLLVSSLLVAASGVRPDAADAESRVAVGGKDPNMSAQIKEGRDFFNEEPKPEYCKPYTYPHPLQGKP